MSNRTTPTPIAVTVSDAAALLGCSRQHIYTLLKRGTLRRLTIAGTSSVRIAVADLYAVLGLDPDGGVA
jgi:excisionase family DNA binding protein